MMQGGLQGMPMMAGGMYGMMPYGMGGGRVSLLLFDYCPASRQLVDSKKYKRLMC